MKQLSGKVLKLFMFSTQLIKSDINLASSDENHKATLSYQFVLYDSYQILPNYNTQIKSYKNRTTRIDMRS